MEPVVYGYGREGEEIFVAASLEDALLQAANSGFLVWVHDPNRIDPEYAWELYSEE